MAIDRNNISLSLSLNILKALGGDTSIEYDSTEAVWEAIDTIYAQSGDRVIVEELILDVVENGNYDYFGNESVDAFAPVQISVNVPQKYTDEQVGSLVETARAEGEATGFASGVADQKSKLESITISQNGTYTNEDGYNEVKVKINAAGFDYTEIGYSEEFSAIINELEASKIAYTKQKEEEWANDPLKSLYFGFTEDTTLVYAPMINNIDKRGSMLSYAFNNCSNLKYIPLYDTSSATTMNQMFFKCISLITIPQLDTSNVTSMNAMFQNCYALTTIPQLDTSNVTSMESTFYDCENIDNVPEIDCSKVAATGYLTGISKQWKNCVTLGGFKNLGMVENVYNFNINNYFIDSSNKLSHDSLMNIINKLYDRAAAGYSNLTLKFGSTNLAKLTAEEIAIATNKGWTLK